MGPMQALTQLGRAATPTLIEEIEATERRVLVAVDLKEDGTATFRQLPTGTVVRAFPLYQRTSGPVPRPFRDTAPYTLGLPDDPKSRRQREAYAGVVEKMVEVHPRSKKLRALLRFLRRKPKVPKWLAALLEDSKTEALFVPYYGGGLVVDAVVDDLKESDPYLPGREEDFPTQPDVVTGEVGPPTQMRPPRVLKMGASSGTTLMSVDDETTGCHGWRGKLAFLQTPVTEATAHHHVRGLQHLVDHGVRVQVYAGTGSDNDGALQYFFWSTSGSPDVPDIFGEVLRESMKLDALEERAKEVSDDGDLCVLGIREGKRIQYVAWHCLPAQEAVQHLLEYGRSRHRPDGSVLTVRDALRGCVPLEVVIDDKKINYKDFDDFAQKRCPPGLLMALLDHVVEGAPFPAALRYRVRLASTDPFITSGVAGASRHSETQEALTE